MDGAHLIADLQDDGWSLGGVALDMELVHRHGHALRMEAAGTSER